MIHGCLKFLNIEIMKTNQMQRTANCGDVMEPGYHFKNGASPKSRRRRLNFLLPIIAIFAVGSCTITSKAYRVNQHVVVTVDAYNNRENITVKKVAMLVCNDATIPKYDLKNMEIENYIKTILATKGYSFTNNNEEANIIIFYEYGISDPKVYTSQHVVPVWGQTGVSSSRTVSGTSFGKPYTKTTYEPSYGVVSSEVVTNTTTEYVRWANISAFDADYYRETGEDKMLWLTEIQSEGSSDDLRYIFPYMLVAAREYIGQSTTDKKVVSLTSDPEDARVLALKNTLVTVILNQATAGRKDPQATVVDDVYRNGELYIKAGTPVSIKRTRSGEDLWLSGFSTTSVHGNKVPLKGSYLHYGKENDGVRNAGKTITLLGFCLCLGCLTPIGVPMWLAGDYHAKVPEGTLYYLEME
jgi:hypothetical protein